MVPMIVGRTFARTDHACLKAQMEEGGPVTGTALTAGDRSPRMRTAGASAQFETHSVNFWSPNRMSVHLPSILTSLKFAANRAPTSTV